MLQKRFVDADGNLNAFRRHSGSHFRTSPGNLFVEGHLYSLESEDGSLDPTLERELATIEAAADPIIERIVAAARRDEAPVVNRTEKEQWDLFLYFQMKRVPEFLKREKLAKAFLEKIDSGTQLLVTQHPDRRAQIEHIVSGDNRERLLRNALVVALGVKGDLVLNALGRRGLCVLRIAEHLQKSFIIGSSPVARLGAYSLSDPTAELWLPIASDVIAGIGPFEQRTRFAPIAAPDAVRRINATVARQSGTFAAASASLVRSLAKPR